VTFQVPEEAVTTEGRRKAMKTRNAGILLFLSAIFVAKQPLVEVR
jgi:hypothetical protein